MIICYLAVVAVADSDSAGSVDFLVVGSVGGVRVSVAVVLFAGYVVAACCPAVSAVVVGPVLFVVVVADVVAASFYRQIYQDYANWFDRLRLQIPAPPPWV